MKLLGIDPSTTNIGIAIIVTDDELNIVDVRTTVLTTDNLKYMDEADLVNRRISILEWMLSDFISMHRDIDHVTIERPFMNSKRPLAMKGLVLSVNSIYDVILNHNMLTRISEYSVNEIKNAVGAKGGSDKDSVESAIHKIKELKPFLNNIETDHEYDALAMAYLQLNKYRQNMIW